jgi:preprotein translocase subunit YajC
VLKVNSGGTLSHLLAAHVLFAATAKTTKSSGSPYTLLLIVGAFALFYFLVIRPRSQRQRQGREQVRAAHVGDEIATIGGLVGTIVAEDGDRVTVSTASGTELVFLRQAIGKKLTVPESTGASDAEAAQFEGTPPGLDGTEESGTPASGDETHPKEPDGS